MDERTRELLELANRKLAELSLFYKVQTAEVKGEGRWIINTYGEHLDEIINVITAHLKENTNV